MENNDNVINLEAKKKSGRPKLTQEQKELKNKLKIELNMLKKAIPTLIDAGFTREQVLLLLTTGKEHLNPYIDKIDSFIKNAFNVKAKNNEKTEGSIKFVDVKYNKDGEITGYKSTVDNFKAIIDSMNIIYKYNLVAHDIDIFRDNILLDDKSALKGEIYSLAQRNECSIKPQDVGMFATTVAIQNKYNPWQDYVVSCLDEFTDVEELKKYETIKAIFNTLKIRNHYDKEFAFILFKKFLMHFIASYTLADYGCNGVFILQGPQNTGKTSFFQNIVPDGFFKSGMSVNPESDDSVRKVLKYMLVELGEIEGTLKADVNKLKNFITEKTFAFRKQYSDFIEENKRYTVLCGTCNSEEFLKDETGDRRYWVIPIGSIDFEELNKVNINKLWAEVYYLFEDEENKIPLVKGKRRKHAHELDREESGKLININREDFTFKSNNHLKIEDIFDWNSDDRYYITSEMISFRILEETVSAALVSRVLPTLGIEKSEKKIRLYGKNTRFYMVPPLIDKNKMAELSLVNVNSMAKKKDLLDKLGEEVEEW